MIRCKACKTLDYENSAKCKKCGDELKSFDDLEFADSVNSAPAEQPKPATRNDNPQMKSEWQSPANDDSFGNGARQAEESNQNGATDMLGFVTLAGVVDDVEETQVKPSLTDVGLQAFLTIAACLIAAWYVFAYVLAPLLISLIPYIAIALVICVFMKMNPLMLVRPLMMFLPCYRMRMANNLHIPAHIVHIRSQIGARKELVLIRIIGEYTSGTVRRGNEIEVTGQNKNGQLHFCSGWNRSFHSLEQASKGVPIQVKKPWYM